MKIHLLFTTRSLTTTNIDMTKKHKITIFLKKLYKKKLMFSISNDEIKKHSIAVAKTLLPQRICHYFN